MTEPRKPYVRPGCTCRFPSCAVYTQNRTGFCRDHVNRAALCCIEGCGTPIAAYNRSGACPAHRRFVIPSTKPSRR